VTDADRITISFQVGGQVSPEAAANQHLWEKRAIPAELADDQPRTVEEWRITGDPGHGYPPYRFTFRSDQYQDPEASARKFCELGGDWANGPHLSHRTVTYSAWSAIADNG
jgi:hypothetical protein